ncbi:hypothetical protein [Nocardia beijingensis]|uniref:hypothetical protein n=1 Tax=Nocardia beijingensis TaxID=95162 RepID=UPI0033A58CC4
MLVAGATLSACLRLAVKRRLLPFNPCDDTNLPSRLYEPTFLEPEEFDVLYDAVPKRWKPMVFFLVTTGVRYSECTALHVYDLKKHVHGRGFELDVPGRVGVDVHRHQ